MIAGELADVVGFGDNWFATRPMTPSDSEGVVPFNFTPEDLNGNPVVLNTSFNLWYEPIVNSPEDALKTWKESGADALVMGTFLIEK